MKGTVILLIIFACSVFADRDRGEEYRFTKINDSTRDFSFE